jgi:acetyl esterase/lipase
MTETWQPGRYLLAGRVTTMPSPVGPIVQPAGPIGTTILYLSGTAAGPGKAALELAGQLALRTGAAVVCCRHRPTFPAALDDVAEAYRYSQATGQVAIAGDRLGAGLAAALLLHLRDKGTGLPQCAVFVSALLDLTMQAPSLRINAAADPAVDATELRRQAARYAGATPLTDPLLSPLRANLHGLPPIQLLTAGNDVLLDDSVAFAARAARSGVSVDLRVRPTGASLRAHTAPDMAGFIWTWTTPNRRAASCN